VKRLSDRGGSAETHAVGVRYFVGLGGLWDCLNEIMRAFGLSDARRSIFFMDMRFISERGVLDIWFFLLHGFVIRIIWWLWF
jgi:hypothetical protein